MRPIDRDTFKAHLSVDNATGCWNWTGFIARNGYGKATQHNRSIGAHRLAYKLFVGPVPTGLFVCHKCDNPPCCNPDHLFVGTALDNTRDMDAKGRRVVTHEPLPVDRRPYGDRNGSRLYPERLWRGERAVGAKLTEDSVREIRTLRAAGVAQKDIADRFGITQPLVSLVTRNKIWRHVQ